MPKATEYKLINSEKFLKEVGKHPIVDYSYVKNELAKHTKDIVDEPHHPSGMDHDKIKIRNELRKELRGE